MIPLIMTSYNDFTDLQELVPVSLIFLDNPNMKNTACLKTDFKFTSGMISHTLYLSLKDFSHTSILHPAH